MTTIPNLVSVIIPVYNRPKMISEAVESVLAQTYRPLEIIIVDDGSTDDTPRVVEELVRQNPEEIRFLRKPNSGPGPTREMGRLAARGEFIQYLDSDDLLRPNKFAVQVRALQEHPECGVAYGYICVHPFNRPPMEKPFKGSGEARPELFPWILADRWWNTDAPLYRRSVCDAIGPWSDLRWSQDWEMDGRVGALRTKLVHTPEFVCDERHHDGVRQTSAADWTQPERLRSRLRFLTMMLGHAEKAGVTADTPQRQHFTRWVFALARQCAAAGHSVETWQAFALAERAAGDCQSVRRGFTAFRRLASIFGVRLTGRLLQTVEAWKRRPSEFTMRESFAKDLG